MTENEITLRIRQLMKKLDQYKDQRKKQEAKYEQLEQAKRAYLNAQDRFRQMQIQRKAVLMKYRTENESSRFFKTYFSEMESMTDGTECNRVTRDIDHAIVVLDDQKKQTYRQINSLEEQSLRAKTEIERLRCELKAMQAKAMEEQL